VPQRKSSFCHFLQQYFSCQMVCSLFTVNSELVDNFDVEVAQIAFNSGCRSRNLVN